MVDSNEHLYVTDDFIVTHNTIIALKTALEIIKDPKSKQDDIILSTLIEPVGRDIGHLPGDIIDKTQCYLE